MTEPSRQVWEEGSRMAMQIILRHKDLFRHVPALSDILFVIDTVSEPMSKGHPVPARLSKVAGKVIDFIDAGAKPYMLEWFESLTKELTDNQQLVLLAEQLLLFEPDGDGAEKIGGFDVVGRTEVREKFGLNPYSPTRGEVPDILDDVFVWGPKARERIQFYHFLDLQKNRLASERSEVKPVFRQTTIEEYTEGQPGAVEGEPAGQPGAKVIEFPPGGRQTGTH